MALSEAQKKMKKAAELYRAHKKKHKGKPKKTMAYFLKKVWKSKKF